MYHQTSVHVLYAVYSMHMLNLAKGIDSIFQCSDILVEAQIAEN